VRRTLLLVPESHWEDAKRDAREMALLATGNRISFDLRHAAFRRDFGDATTHLYLRCGPGLGHTEFGLIDRCDLPSRRCRLPGVEHLSLTAKGQTGRKRSVGRVDARVGDNIASA